jgi:putative transposase
MSRQVSPSANGVLRVTRVWAASRVTLYRHRRSDHRRRGRRPGPVGPMPDEALVAASRKLLAASPFHGEGHQKVWARLRFAGIRTSKRRVLRLMREHDLLAPSRVGRPHGPKAHDGTIRTERVDDIWGTDLTSTMTGEGQASIFVTVDHASTECLGIHAARRATRFEALEPLRQGVRSCFGAFPQASRAACRCVTTMAVSSSPTTTSASSPSSASRAHRPSCASPRATAASSGSSGP